MKTEAQSDRGSEDRKGRAIKTQSVSTPHPCHIGHSRMAWIPSLGAGVLRSGMTQRQRFQVRTPSDIRRIGILGHG